MSAKRTNKRSSDAASRGRANPAQVVERVATRATREALPVFTSEQAEREFWETHDATDGVDWKSVKVAVFPNLKASKTG